MQGLQGRDEGVASHIERRERAATSNSRFAAPLRYAEMLTHFANRRDVRRNYVPFQRRCDGLMLLWNSQRLGHSEVMAYGIS